MIGLFGLDLVSQEPRFTFGFERLETGFSILPVLLGIFAIGHVLHDQGRADGNPPQIKLRIAETLACVTQTLRHWGNLIRSSLVGTWIGLLPGIGANIGSVISYSIARNLSRDPESFGKGSEAGVVASEAGNNATIGGALIPMIAMGIPGSAADVILMAALLFHNVQPGPLLIVEHPETFYGIVTTFLVANVLMFGTLIVLCGWIGKMVDIPRRLLLPGIFVIAVIGVYSTSNRLFDIWVLIGFGIVGWLMRQAKLPSAAFVIGFILAPLLEVNLRSSLMDSQGSFAPFFTRPLSLSILVFSVLFVAWPSIVQLLRRRRAKATSVADTGQ